MGIQLNDPITKLKNVGAARAEALQSRGIHSIKDLIEFFPRDYLDRTELTPISEIQPGDTAVVRVSVVAEAESLRFGRVTVTKVKCADETGVLEAIWYNQPYLKGVFKPKGDFILTGKAIWKMNRLQLESPDYEAVSDKTLLSSGRIVPVYMQTGKLSQKMLRAMIMDALEAAPQIEDTLPSSMREAYGLCGRAFAVRNLHFPESDEAFFAARRRLVFEELLLMQLSLFRMKGFIRDANGIKAQALDETPLMRVLPFAFTNAQDAVLREIKNDMQSGFVMNRLVQGDVGSGKTAVAMAACFMMIQSGYQTVMMAPTETLAAQHFRSFSEIFGQLGIETAILSGSMKKREKDAVKRRLAAGEIHMLVGTHAVIQADVSFQRLGLVITDEQHRFGVRQRTALSQKGAKPHVLVMTATPIPRTLALILYGDMDISIIDELPPGRKEIHTSSVNTDYHARIYAFIKKQIEEGRQIYIICPAIDSTVDADAEPPLPAELQKSKQTPPISVMPYIEELKNKVFISYRMAALHGKMPPAEKDAIMTAFATGEIDILVSTTVVEVGVNVPNATVMLIENAERFGLAQLHQLRGRVGRGAHQSYCVLVTDAKAKVTRERMKAMTHSTDGFYISELDLKLRGPGEFFGTMQHGLPEMKLANLYRDADILKAAQKAVAEVMEQELYQKAEYASLNREIAGLLENAQKIALTL